jgi:trk system potassium uptake protein TrkA
MAPPDSFFGKTIGDLHLRGRFNVDVIAVKEVLSDQVKMVPNAGFVIKDSDILVVIGKEKDIQKMK